MLNVGKADAKGRVIVRVKLCATSPDRHRTVHGSEERHDCMRSITYGHLRSDQKYDSITDAAGASAACHRAMVV